MAEIIALGCGLVGNFVVKKLSNMGIPIHVVDLVIPDDVKTSNKVTFQEGDIFQLLNKLPKSKIVLNLLPGSIGEQIRPMLIGMEMHVIDLAFTEIEPTIHNKPR